MQGQYEYKKKKAINVGVWRTGVPKGRAHTHVRAPKPEATQHVIKIAPSRSNSHRKVDVSVSQEKDGKAPNTLKNAAWCRSYSAPF